MADSGCSVLMRNQRHECRRPVVDRERACIFHLTTKTREQEHQFREEFEKELARMSAVGGISVLDFTRFFFPSLNGEFDLNKFTTTFSKPVVFDNAVFSGGVDFSNCIFEDEADFFQTVFGGKEDYLGRGNFSSCVFKSRATFWAANFTGGSDSNPGAEFQRAVFTGEARFNSAKFDSWAKFTEAHFQGRASFSKAIFGGRADFSSSQFEKEVEFRETRFIDAEFSHAKFSTAALFIETRFPTDFVLNSNSVLGAKGIFFRDVEFTTPEKVQFRGLASAPIDLSNVSFLSTDIEKVIFVDENWQTKRSVWGPGTRGTVIDEALIKLCEQYMDHPRKQMLPTHEKVKQLYRRLRKNYEAAGRYAEAGDFFVGEMEMRRLDTKFKNPLARWFGQNFGLIAWYKHLSLYGESHGRLIAWAIALILLFALLRIIALPVVPQDLTLSMVLTQLYYSVTAFVQLPRGDSDLDLIERVLSALILALLLVSLKRNFERK